MNRFVVLAAISVFGCASAVAQVFRPPPFIAGVPGKAQIQAVEMQRHQARTLLYREAIEELRRNPAIVDIRECVDGGDDQSVCLPKFAGAAVPPAIAGRPTAHRIALLIGNMNYQYPIPSLLTPARDVDQMALVLRNHFGFDVRVLKDASKSALVRAFAKLAREATTEDSVLVYYAGHGYVMDDTGIGYWIPVDGSVKSAAQWISNSTITKLLGAIAARQQLLVSDSCFSGLLAREESLTERHRADPDLLRRRSVLVMSSGGEEPVSDEGKDGHSIFAWHLLRVLGHVDAVTVGFDIYSAVSAGVSSDYPQAPQYGAVLSAGHEMGGEYLFDVSSEPVTQRTDSTVAQ